MDPPSSIPSNCPWMTIESPMEAKYISYLTLSLAFVLCLLSNDYLFLPLFYFLFFNFFYSYLSFFFFFLCLLSTDISYLFFLFLFSFLTMVDIRFLLFCNFTTAKLFNDCSRKAVFFGAISFACKVFDKCSR